MADDVEHCPFLNRSDARCAENFSLDHLQHALRFCFGRYKACTTYVELLVERRIRRGEAALSSFTAAVEANHAAHRLVQLTVSTRDAQHAARAA